MTVPEQAEIQEIDEFNEVLSGVLPLFLLFMYIVPVFNCVSLLVKEKESRVRETMRMMGMTDFPYWMSWFVYYTVVNTILSLIAWLVLCINVFGPTNPLWMLLFIWLYGEAVFG